MSQLIDELRDYSTVTSDSAFSEIFVKAADRIEQLEAALAVAAGMISATPFYDERHPETVLAILLDKSAGYG